MCCETLDWPVLTTTDHMTRTDQNWPLLTRIDGHGTDQNCGLMLIWRGCRHVVMLRVILLSWESRDATHVAMCCNNTGYMLCIKYVYTHTHTDNEALNISKPRDRFVSWHVGALCQPGRPGSSRPWSASTSTSCTARANHVHLTAGRSCSTYMLSVGLL